MATQAQITINSVAGSDDNLPFDTLVQLNNNGLGSELTYEWAIVTQPPGAVDVLSSTSIQAPTFTPTREGTYLIRLIVNKGLIDEKTDTVIAAVRELQTGNRIPAVGETTENGIDNGWAIGAVNDILTRVTRLTDSGMFVAYANEPLTAGHVVHMAGMQTIAAGSSDERLVPTVEKALANDLTLVDGPLGVVVSDVEGNSSISMGELCRVMVIGALPAYSLGAGGAAGDPVYVNDTGDMSLTPGTYVRQVGDVAAVVVAGSTYDIAISAGSNSIPRGNAGGDLSGAYPDPTVIKINGTSVPAGGALLDGQVLRASGGATAIWSAIDLANTQSVSGVLAVDNGGTGNINPGPAGAVAYSDGSIIDYTLAGTSGYLLKSNGAAAPSWLNYVPIANGGTNNIVVGVNGAVAYSDSTKINYTAAGAAGYLLQANGPAAPTWIPSVGTTQITNGAVTEGKVTSTYYFDPIIIGGSTSANTYQLMGTLSNVVMVGNSFKINLQPYPGQEFDFTANNTVPGQRAIFVKYAVVGPTTRDYVYRVQCPGNTLISIYPQFIADQFAAGTYTISMYVMCSTSGDVTVTWNDMMLLAFQP